MQIPQPDLARSITVTSPRFAEATRSPTGTPARATNCHPS